MKSYFQELYQKHHSKTYQYKTFYKNANLENL